MSGYSLSLSIFGNIATKKMLSDIIDAVVEDGVNDSSWGINEFTDNEKVQKYILKCEGEPLVFTSLHHEEEEFIALEEVCLKHGLSFVRKLDPDSENDVDGSRCVYNPVIAADPFDLPGSDDATPLVDAKLIQKILDTGESAENMLAAIRSETTRMIDPTQGMPDGITLDKKLKKAPAAKAAPAP